MKTDLTLPIILQLVGVVVIIAEIILPSGGLLSLLALGTFGYSLYIVFNDISTTIGIIFVTVDMFLIPALVIIGLKLLAKSPVTLRKELSSKDGVTSQSQTLSSYTGLSGTTLTDLRPAGIALIEGKRLDVVSNGEYIEKNSKVTVSEISGNRIVVKLLETI